MCVCVCVCVCACVLCKILSHSSTVTVDILTALQSHTLWSCRFFPENFVGVEGLRSKFKEGQSQTDCQKILGDSGGADMA